MGTKKQKSDTSIRAKEASQNEQGLSVKDLAEKLKVNCRFMVGFLSTLEESDEVYYHEVGSARTYFVNTQKVEQ